MHISLDSAWSVTQQLGLHSVTNMFLPRQLELEARCLKTKKVCPINSN